jgi:hypothetical protein
MTTRNTGKDVGSAARAAKLRLLYQQAGVRVGAILEAPRAPPALRTAARRTLERLTVNKPAARAAGTAKERGARLRALIGALTRLIDRMEGQAGQARAIAGLRTLVTQAQALLAKEQQTPAQRTVLKSKRAVAKPTPGSRLAKAKRKAPAKKAAPKKPMKKAARKAAAKPVKKNGGRRAVRKVLRSGPSGFKRVSAVGSGTQVAPGRGRGVTAPAPGVPETTEAPPAPSTPEITGTPPTVSEPEPVFLGVSAPRAVKPGASFIARFAAYIKAAEAELEKKLTALGGGQVDVHLGIPPDESARWPVGTPVTVRVSGDGFSAQPAQSRFVWNGTENVVSFVIKAAITLAEGSAILSFEVYIEGIRVAFVPIPIEIAAQPADGEQKVKASPARTAFASYASRDRDRVMDKLGALSAYDKGLKVFTDCLDMKPGETWKQRLEAEIPGSDLFLLFWSRAASASQWVSWEWHTALDRKGLAAIQPMPLEAPQVAPPPPELSSLHFNDIYLIVREAELARQPPK